jgi:hypothetical protein
MIVRHDNLAQVPGAYFLATDDERDVDSFARDVIQCGFQFRALW